MSATQLRHKNYIILDLDTIQKMAYGILEAAKGIPKLLDLIF